MGLGPNGCMVLKKVAGWWQPISGQATTMRTRIRRVPEDGRPCDGVEFEAD